MMLSRSIVWLIARRIRHHASRSGYNGLQLGPCEILAAIDGRVYA
jgi:hypothetical protein